MDKKIYISAGIHGDEPAGVLAAMRFLTPKISGVEFIVFPCLNPHGFYEGTRENSEGIDLNRDFIFRESQEILNHVKILEQYPTFDAFINLHEDDRDGCYLYSVGFDEQFSRSVLQDMTRALPVCTDPIIDGFLSDKGIIYRSRTTPDGSYGTEDLYLSTHKNAPGFVLETSTRFPLGKRVKAQVDAIWGIVDFLA